MVAGQANFVSFDNALAREKARQKRKRLGGRHTHLSDRLNEHDYDAFFDPVEIAIPAQKKLKKNPPTSESPSSIQSILDICRKNIPEPQIMGPPPRCCPFHNIILHSRSSASGWVYYRCPVKACVFFCGADNVRDWTKRLNVTLHDSYKEKPSEELQIKLPFTCYCHDEWFHDVKLRKSNSVKNPNRFFITCKKERCKFFQWLDLPLTTEIVKEWTGEKNKVKLSEEKMKETVNEHNELLTEVSIM